MALLGRVVSSNMAALHLLVILLAISCSFAEVTWSSQYPSTGQVTLSNINDPVVLDTSINLEALTITRSTLIVPGNASLDLIASNVNIETGGLLQFNEVEAGLAITFRGIVTVADGGIMTASGSQTATWTRLSQSVVAGATVLPISNDISSTPDDEVVITSTDYSAAQSERHTLTAQQPGSLTLATGLVNSHHGNEESGVPEFAEVGVLTRPIRFMQTHVVGRAGSVVRLEGVQFIMNSLDQANVRLESDISTSWVKYCSFDTVKTAIELHTRSSSANVSSNVAFGCSAGCIVSEAVSATIIDNLVVARQSSEPTGILVTGSATSPVTGLTTLIGNAVAGFSIGLEVRHTFCEAGAQSCPNWYMAAVSVIANIVHSASQVGLSIGAQSHESPVLVSQQVAYKNQVGAQVLLSQGEIVESSFADNLIGVLLDGCSNDGGEVSLKDSLVVGLTSNLGDTSSGTRSLPMAEDQAQLVFVGVALAGSTWHRIRDTHFADLTDDFGLGVAIGWAQKTSTCILNADNDVSGLSFQTVEHRTMFLGSTRNFDVNLYAMIADSDGSLCGTSGCVMLPNIPAVVGDQIDCVPASSALAVGPSSPAGYACSSDVHKFALVAAFSDAETRTPDLVPAQFVAEDGNTSVVVKESVSMYVRINQTTSVFYNTTRNPDWPDYSKISVSAQYLQPGDWILMKLHFDEISETFRVLKDGATHPDPSESVASALSMTELFQSKEQVTSYLEHRKGILFVKFVGKDGRDKGKPGKQLLVENFALTFDETCGDGRQSCDPGELSTVDRRYCEQDCKFKEVFFDNPYDSLNEEQRYEFEKTVWRLFTEGPNAIMSGMLNTAVDKHNGELSAKVYGHDQMTLEQVDTLVQEGKVQFSFDGVQFSARTTPGTTDSGGSGTNIPVIIAALAVVVLVLAVVMGVVAKRRRTQDDGIEMYSVGSFKKEDPVLDPRTRVLPYIAKGDIVGLSGLFEDASYVDMTPSPQNGLDASSPPYVDMTPSPQNGNLDLPSPSFVDMTPSPQNGNLDIPSPSFVDMTPSPQNGNMEDDGYLSIQPTDELPNLDHIGPMDFDSGGETSTDFGADSPASFNVMSPVNGMSPMNGVLHLNGTNGTQLGNRDASLSPLREPSLSPAPTSPLSETHFDMNLLSVSSSEMANTCDNRGNSAVAWAVLFDSTIAIRMLIKYGANLNTRNAKGQTPLHLSCTKGDGIDPIRILVENGAHVNEVDDQGNTPLMLACRMCNLEVCKFLLDNRADVHVKDSTDMNVFMITAALGRDNILDALINSCGDLIEGQGPSAADVNGWTSLHWAASTCQSACVDRLLHCKSVDLCAVNNKGQSALHLAAREGDAESVQVLCSEQVRTRSQIAKLLSLTGVSGFTAAEIAEHGGFAQLAGYLHQCELHFQDPTLHKVAQYSQSDDGEARKAKRKARFQQNQQRTEALESEVNHMELVNQSLAEEIRRLRAEAQLLGGALLAAKHL